MELPELWRSARLRGEWPHLPTGKRGQPIRATAPDASARTDWQIALVSPRVTNLPPRDLDERLRAAVRQFGRRPLA